MILSFRHTALTVKVNCYELAVLFASHLGDFYAPTSSLSAMGVTSNLAAFIHKKVVLCFAFMMIVSSVSAWSTRCDKMAIHIVSLLT